MYYYVVEHRYLGNNEQMNVIKNENVVEIRMFPAYSNGGVKPCLHGWCSSTQNWIIFAYGAYPTLKEARDFILKNFSGAKEVELDGGYGVYDVGIAERYRIEACQ